MVPTNPFRGRPGLVLVLLATCVLCVLAGALTVGRGSSAETDPPTPDVTATETPVDTPTPEPTATATPVPTPAYVGVPPAAPTGVTASLTPAGDVRVDWADNAEPDLAYYAVRWTTSPDLDKSKWTVLARPKVSEATLLAPPAGKTVYFYVTAVDDENGNGVFDAAVDRVSDRSAVAQVDVPPLPTTTPTPSPVPTPTPTPSPTPVPGGEPPWTPLWAETFDDGLANGFYQYLHPTQGTRAFPDTVVKLHGAASWRMELRKGDTANSDGKNRNQYRGIAYGNHYFNAGEGRFFRFAVSIDPSMTIGASFANPWRTLVAWPSVQDGAFSPLKYMLQREGTGGASPTGTDALVLAGDLGHSGANDTPVWRLNRPVQGAFYEFIVHWVFSNDPAVGLVEQWLRKPGEATFTKQTFANGATVMHMRTLSAAAAQSNLRLGLYRNAAFVTTDSVHYDDVLMGSSFASVGGVE